MWSKLRRNVRAHVFRLKMCGATQYKPNRSKSTSRTFDRRGVFVKACPMLIARAHMQHMQHMQQSQQFQQSQQQSSSQRVGALSLIPFCLGISLHTSGSRQGHPRYTGARSVGRPWPEHSSAQQYSAETRETCFSFFLVFLFSFIFSFFFFLSATTHASPNLVCPSAQSFISVCICRRFSLS